MQQQVGENWPEYGAIEAGGTKFLCATGSGPHDLRDLERVDTSTPSATLGAVLAYFGRRAAGLRAIGIASFGPLDLVPASPTFGFITTTPKPGWAWTDLGGTVSRVLGLPVAIDTDTNAAALAEQRWGAAQGLKTFAYLTIGTGIGAGIMANGSLVHGLMHPEFGHIRLPHDATTDPFPGSCPFHGDCLEGLASGAAIGLRWRTNAAQLPPVHAAWDLEAHYLAAALATLSLTLAPERIIMGGGVMRQVQLFPRIRSGVQQALGGYLPIKQLGPGIDGFIVPPGLRDRSGILGAIALAMDL